MAFLPPLRSLDAQSCPVCGARVAYAPVQPVRHTRWVWCAARCGDEMWPEGEPPEVVDPEADTVDEIEGVG